MSVRFTVRYLPIAQDDLVSVLDYIARDSPQRASAFIEKIDQRIGRLEQHPNLGRIPRHPHLKEQGYRVLIVESFLVFYIIRSGVVEVHRIVHGSRNLDHLF